MAERHGRVEVIALRRHGSAALDRVAEELHARRIDPVVAGATGVNVLLVGALVVGTPIELIALAAVAIPVGLAILARPQLGVLLVVGVLPYDGLLLIAPVPAAAFAWKEAVVVATVFAAAIAPPGVRAPEGRALPSFTGPIVALGLLSLVSAAAVGGLQGVYGLKVLLFYTVLAAAAWRCPLSVRERDLLVGTLMVNGVIVASWGIAQQAIGADGLHALGYEYNTAIRFAGGFLRSFSTFEEPFGYAYFLLAVLCVGIPVALADPTRVRNRLFLLALPVLALGMAVSVVRGSMLGAAVLLGYLGFRAAVRRRVLLVAFPLALAALLVVPASVTGPALSSSSTGERTSGWTDALPEIVARPFGAGLGSAGAVADKVSIIAATDARTYQPDNIYVLRMLEVGPLGVIFQVLLLITAFRTASRVARQRSGVDSALADGVAALTAAIAVAGLISTIFEIFPTDAVWWTLLAVVAAVGASSGEASPRPLTTEAQLPMMSQ